MQIIIWFLEECYHLIFIDLSIAILIEGFETSVKIGIRESDWLVINFLECLLDGISCLVCVKVARIVSIVPFKHIIHLLSHCYIEECQDEVIMISCRRSCLCQFFLLFWLFVSKALPSRRLIVLMRTRFGSGLLYSLIRLYIFLNLVLFFKLLFIVQIGVLF